MRTAFFILCAAISCSAFSQQMTGVTLGAPQLVAKKVQEVFWSPNGKALAYRSETKDGFAIGIFDVEKDEGKNVLNIKKGDEVTRLEWLASNKKVLVVVKSRGDNPSLQVSVLDLNMLEARQMWNHPFAKDSDVSLDVDVSPILDHALITVGTEKGDETWVLTSGASGFVFSRDIAQAKTDGHMFAGWSNAGTAVFGTIGNGSSLNISALTAEEQKRSERLNAVVEFSVATQVEGKALVLSDLPLTNMRFRMMPSVQKGESTLECVPGNGVLRTVKFPGYFEQKPGPVTFPSTYNEPQQMKLGKSQADSNSLWLTPTVAQPVPKEELISNHKVKQEKPSEGVLVSAQADLWWAAPYTRAVAFTWNGALFVRTVTGGTK